MSYTKHAWVTGETITAEKLNNIEDGVDDLNRQLSDVDPILFDTEASRNIYTPTTTRVYPESGTATISEDKTITISDVPPTGVNVWLNAQEGLNLPAGDYTLCLDDGLYWYGYRVIVIQTLQSGSWQTIVTATGNVTPFTLSDDVLPEIRVAIYNANRPTAGADINWSGHIWICSGDYQDYMPVGGETKTAKEFVNEDQGIENAGKLLGVDADGIVSPVENKSETAVQETIYQYGNLLDYDEVTGGYINASGVVVPYQTLWCSGYMPVKQGRVYCSVTGTNGGTLYASYFAFYDENKENPVTYTTTGAMTQLTPVIYYVNVPEGCSYFRCTFSNNQQEIRKVWISQKPENPPDKDLFNCDGIFPYVLNPENPCDYSELTVRAFSKVVCIGDSLTYGGFNMDNSSSSSGQTQSNAELSERYSYPSNFQRITGIETVNEGDSGETTVSWYNNHSSHDFSKYDLAIIHLGVNDSAFGVSDADTLAAMQNIVTMLHNARSDMRIAICSVIPAYDGVGYQAKGQLILNWAKSLNNSNIIPLDLAAYSHVRPQTSYVAGHCSALGYYMMAFDIARYISWYMDNHKRDFRFIQFIGSPDAEWTGD